LVLGGGGLAGIAWLTGVLYGLAEAGVNLTNPDLVVGTSAGSTVGAQLASGLPLAELYQRQVDPALRTPELVPTGMSVEELLRTMVTMTEETPDPVELRRRIGKLALNTPTVDEAARHAVIEARLPKHEWPSWPLRIVAVDAYTGETAVFDRDAAISLVDAVAASCAVPGVWPAVTIGSSRYVDGAVRTLTNLDLARDHRRVLVIAPMVDLNFPDQLAELTGRVEVIQPDEASQAAFGTDVLDPAVRTPAAQAGRAQGQREAARVAALWT
jgi:NTE family protein